MNSPDPATPDPAVREIRRLVNPGRKDGGPARNAKQLPDKRCNVRNVNNNLECQGKVEGTGCKIKAVAGAKQEFRVGVFGSRDLQHLLRYVNAGIEIVLNQRRYDTFVDQPRATADLENRGSRRQIVRAKAAERLPLRHPREGCPASRTRSTPQRPDRPNSASSVWSWTQNTNAGGGYGQWRRHTRTRSVRVRYARDLLD